MKRSAQVMLVISGAILSGCSKQQSTGWDSPDSAESSQVLTNNTYVAGRGYYHAPYHAFYPFPYNFYAAGRGYYHGGNYTVAPNNSSITASSPPKAASRADRGGFTRSSSSRIGHVYS